MSSVQVSVIVHVLSMFHGHGNAVTPYRILVSINVRSTRCSAILRRIFPRVDVHPHSAHHFACVSREIPHHVLVRDEIPFVSGYVGGRGRGG